MRRWQWFIALEPSTAFTVGLRQSDPFQLTKIDHASFDGENSSPAWFAAAPELARCEIWQSAGQGMTVIFDPAQRVIYAPTAATVSRPGTHRNSPPSPFPPPSPPERQTGSLTVKNSP